MQLTCWHLESAYEMGAHEARPIQMRKEAGGRVIERWLHVYMLRVTQSYTCLFLFKVVAHGWRKEGCAVKD